MCQPSATGGAQRKIDDLAGLEQVQEQIERCPLRDLTQIGSEDHFRSKRELYQTLLRRHFNMAAERFRAIAAGSDTPPEKLDRVVAGLAALIREHESFPAIMLREVAEGGAHLDRDTLLALVSVPRAFFSIVEDGVKRGVFRPVHPVVAYFATLPPIVFFLAAERIRTEVASRRLLDLTALNADEFVHQLQQSLRRALVREPDRSTRST